jgi:HAD superfamily hydrolase (TIGR01509 family)
MSAPRTKFRAVIFDCDGTLVDSEPLGIAALLAEARSFGLQMSTTEAMEALRGKKMAVCVGLLEARLGRTLPDDFVPNVRQRMAGMFRTGLKEIAGARSLVSALSIPYCIATNGPMEKVTLTLEVTGISDIFSGPIFSAYDVGHWKPSPELFLHAARSLGVSPAECAVVEDSAPGVEAGLAAGMNVFALISSHDDFTQYSSRGVVLIRSLADLERYLI